ncbi:MAG: GguC protein, partial [Tepidisphaeraceae bacterium]
MIRLVQLSHPTRGRCVAQVEEPRLRLLRDAATVYALALEAIAAKSTIESIVQSRVTEESLEYDSIYSGRSEWSLLPPFDHPLESARCLVTGTGLTHKASAENRQAM